LVYIVINTIFERSGYLKKLLISLLVGIVIGITISSFVFDGDFIYYYTINYPPEVKHYDLDFDLVFKYLDVVLFSFLLIYIFWVLIEKIIKYFASKNG
jgi:uncharacterized membrane protein